MIYYIKLFKTVSRAVFTILAIKFQAIYEILRITVCGPKNGLSAFDQTSHFWVRILYFFHVDKIAQNRGKVFF